MRRPAPEVLRRLADEADETAARIAELDPPKLEDYRHANNCGCKECAALQKKRRGPAVYSMAFHLHRDAAQIRRARLDLLDAALRMAGDPV